MNAQYRKMKRLFLRQSCKDSWDDFERSINKEGFLTWDYVIVTASNEEQARNYREQIRFRKEYGLLPARPHYAVLPDPGGKRVGSGGATFHVMRYIRENEQGQGNPFSEKRILVIHSGGDSKRVPQYSSTGKLFSPVPRELPNGQASTLFDEFMISMAGVPSRIKEGMLVLSGDVLLLFNPLQIDTQFHGAAAISFKENVAVGKEHGVFLNDGNDYVRQFLHKQAEETLEKAGAVNSQGCVDLDTGAVLLDAELLWSLFGLISTNNRIDEEKFSEFVNEKARISFYGDLLYPLALDSTEEAYYQEAPEGSFTEELRYCREKIWEAIHRFHIKLLNLSPAEFIHFGTTSELLALMTKDIGDYEFLDWKEHVLSNTGEKGFASYGTYIGKEAQIGRGCYLEHSFILGNTSIGEGSIVSSMYLRDAVVPGNVVLHGLLLKDGGWVARIYGVWDNPKDRFVIGNRFLDEDMESLREALGSEYMSEGLTENTTLWDLPLYVPCSTSEEALDMALLLYRIVKGTADKADQVKWQRMPKLSLNQSFNLADSEKMRSWQQELKSRILASQFVESLEKGQYYQDALQIFGKRGITEEVFREILKDVERAEAYLKLRIYYALSRYMKAEKKSFGGYRYGYYENLCFQTIEQTVAEPMTNMDGNIHISEKEVYEELPCRVNWGGGWTDTPPYCLENGGIVLNAAVKVRGILPIQVHVRRLEEPVIKFASEDIDIFGQAATVEEILDCNNPYDAFALHKAALIATGIIPRESSTPLNELLKSMGGGIYLSTQVSGIPKGSGLGTSSILSAACARALFRFIGVEKSDQEIFTVVSHMEQLMSTGGGWQDQAGGLLPGIKLLRTVPGNDQKIQVEQVELSKEAKKELQERFALVYTGQRRLARNLLRDVVGGYIGARPESVHSLEEMQSLAVLMKYKLEKGDITGFAKLLDRHWEVSKTLDSGSTNTCIDQILLSCADLIDGRFIAGAGGGGFLQVILKKGVSKTELSRRLRNVFQDSGVDVWECEFAE